MRKEFHNNDVQKISKKYDVTRYVNMKPEFTNTWP